jgi:Predicted ATPases of PP-loop superfamily
MKQRVLLSWSSGKDSAWTLYQLQKQEQVELCGLLTTFNGANQRVAMHAVRRELVEAQAEAAGLPLWAIDLPYPCSNEDYESRMQQLLARARAEGITHIAFGDLFLEDVRAYRERMMSGSGIDPLFPLWGNEYACPGGGDVARRPACDHRHSGPTATLRLLCCTPL